MQRVSRLHIIAASRGVWALITDDQGGGGYKYQKIDYVIFERPLQRTSGKWGGGVVLKFRTFPDGGRGGGL